MSLLVPPRRYDPAVPEIMDRPGNDSQLLRDDLLVLEKINRFLGGHTLILRHLDRLLRQQPSGNPVTILDLATGAGDVPRRLVQWARTRQFPVRVTATDGNPDILTIARERTADWPEIHLEQQDVLALPYPAGSFDFVLCALTLHHFSETDAVAILRRIRDIARVGYIVNDLRRNRVAVALAKLMAQTIITNPIAQFDAPASCERAFSITELHRMAECAGLTGFAIQRHRYFRMALVGTK